MTTPYLSSNNDAALDLYEADGVTPNAATLVLLSHKGTLDTTGHGDGDTERTLMKGDYEVLVGADNSAAAISDYLDPDLDPLPDGYVAAPVYDGPIY